MKPAEDPESGADQVQAAFKALFTSIPIETLEIKTRTETKMESRPLSQQGFSILLDGKVFNDIKKVFIEPVSLGKQDI